MPFRVAAAAAGGGLHHAPHRDVVFRRQHVQRGGGHRAAGDDDGLQIEGPQKGHVLPGIADDGVLGAAAVGHPPGIAEIDDILSRQQVLKLPHRRQAAQTRIKDANGPIIHKKTSRRSKHSPPSDPRRPLWRLRAAGSPAETIICETPGKNKWDFPRPFPAVPFDKWRKYTIMLSAGGHSGSATPPDPVRPGPSVTAPARCL